MCIRDSPRTPGREGVIHIRRGVGAPITHQQLAYHVLNIIKGQSRRATETMILGRGKATMPEIIAGRPSAARARTRGPGSLGVVSGALIAASTLAFLSFRQMSLALSAAALLISLYGLKRGLRHN